MLANLRYYTHVNWLVQIVEATNRQLWDLLVFAGQDLASALKNLGSCQHNDPKFISLLQTWMQLWLGFSLIVLRKP